ncbi:hypothetical protein CFC21_102011 [Triticum aestivum]|uniref:Uncharacterized protein n=2 Tax=Triticum aestivum TaxID=4565 RepID=A0A9R1M4H6_WHEAT|nr:uncharacterized protein LOC123159660 [Triticum aestivum]KAF7100501.1 hypothetical protein CFC21_102011 [Triticum aestivum]
MQRSNSFGTSWADQWDTGADPSPRARGGNGDGQKGGVEKTKAAAATGLRKVKAGTAQGFQWIKDKYQKKSAGKNGKQGGGSEVAAGY